MFYFKRSISPKFSLDSALIPPVGMIRCKLPSSLSEFIKSQSLSAEMTVSLGCSSANRIIAACFYQTPFGGLVNINLPSALRGNYFSI